MKYFSSHRFRLLATTAIISTTLLIEHSSFADEKSNFLVFDKPKWNAHSFIDLKAGNRRNIGQVGFVSPLAQNDRSMLFTDFRYMHDSTSNAEGNFGLAYRIILNDWVYGGYGFFDHRNSSFGNTFNELAFGFEALSTTWEYRINTYVPLSNKKLINSSIETKDEIVGNEIYIKTINSETFDIPLGGFDFELGYQILKGLRLYGAVYHFAAKQAPSVTGSRVRITYDITENFSLEGQAQYDRNRKETFFAGVRFTIPLSEDGPQRELTDVEKLMLRPIVRDVDAVTVSQTSSQTIREVLLRPKNGAIDQASPTLQELVSSLERANVDSLTPSQSSRALQIYNAKKVYGDELELLNKGKNEDPAKISRVKKRNAKFHELVAALEKYDIIRFPEKNTMEPVRTFLQRVEETNTVTDTPGEKFPVNTPGKIPLSPALSSSSSYKSPQKTGGYAGEPSSPKTPIKLIPTWNEPQIGDAPRIIHSFVLSENAKPSTGKRSDPATVVTPTKDPSGLPSLSSEPPSRFVRGAVTPSRSSRTAEQEKRVLRGEGLYPKSAQKIGRRDSWKPTVSSPLAAGTFRGSTTLEQSVKHHTSDLKMLKQRELQKMAAASILKTQAYSPDDSTKLSQAELRKNAVSEALRAQSFSAEGSTALAQTELRRKVVTDTLKTQTRSFDGSLNIAQVELRKNPVADALKAQTYSADGSMNLAQAELRRKAMVDALKAQTYSTDGSVNLAQTELRKNAVANTLRAQSYTADGSTSLAQAELRRKAMVDALMTQTYSTDGSANLAQTELRKNAVADTLRAQSYTTDGSTSLAQAELRKNAVVDALMTQTYSTDGSANLAQAELRKKAMLDALKAQTHSTDSSTKLVQADARKASISAALSDQTHISTESMNLAQAELRKNAMAGALTEQTHMAADSVSLAQAELRKNAVADALMSQTPSTADSTSLAQTELRKNIIADALKEQTYS
ncbi:MAG: hypothetical protein HOL16_01285, partial [Alphaproteobacteria bacterium]|nr:hypothetical protein [Alphaproteobacteria bacterium]